MYRIFLLLSLVFCAHAEVISIRSLSDWMGNVKGIQEVQPGWFRTEKSIVLLGRGTLGYDVARRYVVAGNFRRAGGAGKVRLTFGFAPLTASGRSINCSNVSVVRESDTVLLTAAAAADAAILVKDASHWKTGGAVRLAYGTRPDFSDLPNFNVTGSLVSGISREGAVWRVQFRKPVGVNLQAGIGLRQHYAGGAMYPVSRVILNEAWEEYSGWGQGQLKKPGMYPRNFPLGTGKVRLILVINCEKPGCAAEFRDITLEAE